MKYRIDQIGFFKILYFEMLCCVSFKFSQLIFRLCSDIMDFSKYVDNYNILLYVYGGYQLLDKELYMI